MSDVDFVRALDFMAKAGSRDVAAVIMSSNPAAYHDSELLDLTILVRLGPDQRTRIAIASITGDVVR